MSFLVVDTENDGILAIRVEKIDTVEAYSYGGRNMACKINGVKTKAGFDFVIQKLGTKCHNMSKMPDVQLDFNRKVEPVAPENDPGIEEY